MINNNYTFLVLYSTNATYKEGTISIISTRLGGPLEEIYLATIPSDLDLGDESKEVDRKAATLRTLNLRTAKLGREPGKVGKSARNGFVSSSVVQNIETPLEVLSGARYVSEGGRRTYNSYLMPLLIFAVNTSSENNGGTRQISAEYAGSVAQW